MWVFFKTIFLSQTLVNGSLYQAQTTTHRMPPSHLSQGAARLATATAGDKGTTGDRENVTFIGKDPLP